MDSTPKNPNTSSHLTRLIEHVEVHLAHYYGLDILTSAEGFLTSLPKSFLEAHCRDAIDLPAAFLVSTAEDEAMLAIHLDQKIIDSLAGSPNLASLLKSRDGLNAFMILVEELSHFHFFVSKADQDIGVSRFDLELQAEIDKLLIGSLTMRELFGSTQIIPLAQVLFNESKIHGSLTDYALASRLAEKFWKNHIKTFGQDLIFDSRIRRLMQSFARASGQEKRKIIDTELKIAA